MPYVVSFADWDYFFVYDISASDRVSFPYIWARHVHLTEAIALDLILFGGDQQELEESENVSKEGSVNYLTIQTPKKTHDQSLSSCVNARTVRIL